MWYHTLSTTIRASCGDQWDEKSPTKAETIRAFCLYSGQHTIKDSIRFSNHGNFCCANYTQGMCTGTRSRQGGAGRHSHYRNTRPQRLTAYYTDWHCSLQQWSETHSSIATHDSTIIQLSSACIIHLILVLPAHRLKNYFLLPLTTYTGTYI